MRGPVLADNESKIQRQNFNIHKYLSKYWVYSLLFELFFPFKLCKTYQDMFNKEFNCQKIFQQKSSKIAITYIFPSKNQARMAICFPHQQESSKTTVARKDSIKIKMRILTPKISWSTISSKSCPSLQPG